MPNWMTSTLFIAILGYFTATMPTGRSPFGIRVASSAALSSSPVAGACEGCDLVEHASAGLPVNVDVDFGPASFPGICTGEQEPCTAQECHLQTLVYYVTNPGPAGVDLTFYSGSFPTLTGTRITLAAASQIRVEVGQLTDPQTLLECGSYKALVTVGLEDAGVRCTKCE